MSVERILKDNLATTVCDLGAQRRWIIFGCLVTGAWSASAGVPTQMGPTIVSPVADHFQLELIILEKIGTIAQMQFGPDGRLYAASSNHGIFRFDYCPGEHLANKKQVANTSALGIAFHNDPALGTVMYLTPYEERGVLRRLTDDDGDGRWGEDGEVSQDIVMGIPITGHRMNQIQIRHDMLYVGIGTRTDEGTDENAYTGTVAWIQNLMRLADTTTANLAGFDSQDFETGAMPYLSTAVDKLVIHSTGARNPFGLAFDGDGHLWMTNNQNDKPPITQDQLFKTFEKADYGFPSHNRETNWRTRDDVRNAGYYHPANRVASLTVDTPNEAYEPDEPTPGGLPPGGLGPHSSADGLDFYRGNELPVRWHKDAFVARFSPHPYGAGMMENYRDLVAVDLDTGEVVQIVDDFDLPLDVLMDGCGNVLVSEGNEEGRIWRISPKNPIAQAHRFAWDADRDGHWSNRLFWTTDIDGDGRIDESIADKDRMVPDAWGTARYEVTIDRLSADPTITVDQDVQIERLNLGNTLRVKEGCALMVTDGLTMFDDATLVFELGGPDEEDFGRLLSSGDVELNGQIVIALADGFSLTKADHFNIIVAERITKGSADFDFGRARFKVTVVPVSGGRSVLRLSASSAAGIWMAFVGALVALIVLVFAFRILQRVK